MVSVSRPMTNCDGEEWMGFRMALQELVARLVVASHKGCSRRAIERRQDSKVCQHRYGKAYVRRP